MSETIVIVGTDTDVGKTVFAAALAGALRAHYWKPVQAGLEGGGDSEVVAALSGLPRERILSEIYRLTTPASPHLAAERDGIAIDVERLARDISERVATLPGPLLIEAAGGLMVPLARWVLQIDLLSRLGFPVVLVARTALGTINHSLLSIEALRLRDVPIVGVAFVGSANEDSEAAIATLGGVRRLGRLPRLEPVTCDGLSAAFAANFNIADFA